MELSELAESLGRLTDAASEAGTRVTEQEWRQPWAAGKWTRIEVLGHLVDSAAHNHQRFARALHEDSLAMPGYNGDAQVRVQRYAAAPIAAVVEAWRAQNRLIGYVLAQIPADKEKTPCTIGAHAPITLRELAFDYVAHLEHHLRQIFADSDTLKYREWRGRRRVDGSSDGVDVSRIVLATSGSLGELNPYIAVGEGLKQRGHSGTV